MTGSAGDDDRGEVLTGRRPLSSGDILSRKHQGDVLRKPEIDFEPPTFRVEGQGYDHRAPFSPFLIWSPTPEGGLVAGASD